MTPAEAANTIELSLKETASASTGSNVARSALRDAQFSSDASVVTIPNNIDAAAKSVRPAGTSVVRLEM